jgi:hypothetical protein
MLSRSLGLLGLLALLGPLPANAQARIEADQVIAAFIYRFPQFVEWPAAALEEADSLEICVAEPDPFGPEFGDWINGENLNGHPFSRRDVAAPRAVEGCHVLFISSATQRSGVLLRAAQDSPILTIGESSSFLREGGIIGLQAVNGRIRFEVNQDAATRAGLRLSAQLLNLALVVHGGPE